MADAVFYPTFCNVPQCKRVSIRFFPDAASAPTFTAADNIHVDTITRVSQGLYRVALKHTYRRLMSAQVSLQVNAALAAGRTVQVGPVANVGSATAVTVDVLYLDGSGAVADPAAANANNSISLDLTFSDVGAN